MRFAKKRVTARTTASALALAMVAVLVTALPASASTVTSFTPVCGVVGTLVTITGTGFTGMTSVTFDAGLGRTNVDSTVDTEVSDTTATAEVPVGAVTGKIRVNVPVVNDDPSVADFTVAAAAAATITGFTPASGPVGQSVVITGTNFCGTTSVTFNGTAATFTVNSATQITATVPATATTGLIRVIAPSGGVNSATNFTVAAVPTITSFTPTSGAVGASVVITGTNLSGATLVRFNGVSATFTVNSANQITATVPATATTGTIQVTTPGGVATSPTNFTVVAAPTITSFTPTSGPVGTSVTITGTNLSGVTAVKFNGVTATFTTSTATSVTATVPSGATTGKITVTNPGGTATSATDFTVTITKHARSVNLNLNRHLIATGTVIVGDGFNACRSDVTVVIQRLKNGNWRTLGTDQTTAAGKYKEALDDRTGKYRAIAKKEVLNGGADICMADTSAPERHRH